MVGYEARELEGVLIMETKYFVSIIRTLSSALAGNAENQG